MESLDIKINCSTVDIDFMYKMATYYSTFYNHLIFFWCHVGRKGMDKDGFPLWYVDRMPKYVHGAHYH